ncbi:hypothetical protein L211DRAFT_854379 [Terfezia boudieri ATCC MYA-4762]|uniref:DUF6532 domain-containing protein n=1 Tax=Terfezia boudieri ATCC MYA-4762 TaxID=1051890 RepID=A0A3N4LJR8_9PEZI|nr:hypothetical protein L211DRAFT_854379 [Terfezia boudieri ATCC MYA-4762]
MYPAAKLDGPTSDHKKPSAMRGRTTSDGGLTWKRRDQMNELEGNKCLRFQEPTQEESTREVRKEITEISDSEQEEEERNSADGSDSDVVEIKGLPNSGRKSRSFAAIPPKLQGLCYVAQNWVMDYTFFKCPFLSALDVINLIDEAWEGAQDQEKSYLRRTKACEQVSKEEVAKKVDWLLHKDRFVCREEQQETPGHRFRASEIVTVIYESFFWQPKMRGKRDSKFFDNINHIFICLVVAAMQHCLKKLKTGEATEAVEFKYKTAATTFHRLQNTWGLYDEKVRTLILANIKADLRTRISGFDKKAEMEASDPCAVVEGESYISELQNELKNTMLAQNLVGSDALSEETRNQGNTVVKEAIEKIDADVRDDQWEGSPTDVDEPVKVDDGDWQESQVAY